MIIIDADMPKYCVECGWLIGSTDKSLFYCECNGHVVRKAIIDNKKKSLDCPIVAELSNSASWMIVDKENNTIRFNEIVGEEE